MITIVIPTWAFWVFVALLLIGTGLNVVSIRLGSHHLALIRSRENVAAPTEDERGEHG